jgi:hypothetical protein
LLKKKAALVLRQPSFDYQYKMIISNYQKSVFVFLILRNN